MLSKSSRAASGAGVVASEGNGRNGRRESRLGYHLGQAIQWGPMTDSQPPAAERRLLVRPLKIGPVAIDPPVLMAPMAGFTDCAYRRIVRRFGGVGLAAAEMVSARAFLEIHGRGDDLPGRLWGVRDEPRPLAVQIWDNDPGALAQVGAQLAHDQPCRAQPQFICIQKQTATVGKLLHGPSLDAHRPALGRHAGPR